MAIRVIPFIFVLLWASGFIGAKFGLAYAEPATLLLIRMIATTLVFTLCLLLVQRNVPDTKQILHSCVVGVLIHGCYLGGTFMAISMKMPAGLASLLVGLQPIFTALLLVGGNKKKFQSTQWIGLLIGLVGITLVLSGDLAWDSGSSKLIALSMSLLALCGITFGTLYQKHYCQGTDILWSSLIQYIAASIVFAPYALLFETMSVQWDIRLFMVLAWLVFGLSCCAVLLLLYMVQQGAAESVASIFYLVPPVTAIQSWILFDEKLGLSGLFGFVLAALAICLVTIPHRIRGVYDKTVYSIQSKLS